MYAVVVRESGQSDAIEGSEAHLAASCLYVLENPVRAGLSEKPGDWPWSGCPALGG